MKSESFMNFLFGQPGCGLSRWSTKFVR